MRARWSGGAFVLSLALLASGAAAHEGHNPPSDAAPSYAFPIAKPGTYSLPPIKSAGSGRVLDENGRRHELAELLRGRATVLAFIYTRCSDVCPTATLDMSRLQDLAAKDPDISRRMRLVTMSFDPEHDTPPVMREFAQQWRSAARMGPEWLFLTALDRETLAPVLAAYNQPVTVKRDAGSPGGPLHHMFRAFLIDGRAQVRNIYSLDFFDPQLVLNDVRTLLMETSSRLGRGLEPGR